MAVRWFPDGPVMADGVYEAENSQNTTEIDRLDKVQNTAVTHVNSFLLTVLK